MICINVNSYEFSANIHLYATIANAFAQALLQRWRHNKDDAPHFGCKSETQSSALKTFFNSILRKCDNSC